jgi:transcriptional regulator GlxA family with amidase domain
MMKQLFFLILPNVHALDLAGPVQVFHEANGFGGAYRLRYCGTAPKVRMAQGLCVADLEPLPRVGPDDMVLVPGIESSTLDNLAETPSEWLRESYRAGARICSICSGAFVIAHAGLLDGRECTTHWKDAGRLERAYPAVRVDRNRLFVKDGRLTTSAGIASGIDMALSMVEEDHGPMVAAKVAREIVVYMRRSGSSEQTSVYVKYRTHLNAGVHRVQDWLIAHPGERPSLDEMAKIAGMSRRNLTRTFRQATSISLKQFTNELKLEVAANLLHDPDLTIENVAARCGFKDARQLRRLCKTKLGVNPSAWKEGLERRATR